jgi:hypothetical protein
MNPRSLCFAALLLLGAASAAQANGSVYSPIVAVGNGSLLQCTALNAGKKAIDLSVAIFNSAGGLIEGSDCPDREPGTGCITGALGDVLGYCRVTYSGSKKNVRRGLQVVDASGNTVLNLEAK